jgi:hypothetical protein
MREFIALLRGRLSGDTVTFAPWCVEQVRHGDGPVT